MIRRTVILAILLGLTACSPAPPKPECIANPQEPIDGGIGGTGKRPDPCPPAD